MALDPRLECLPEHEGPAFRTWQLIMQTTMGKVMQPTGFQFNKSDTTTTKSPHLLPADEFISLDGNKDDIHNQLNFPSNLKRKKLQTNDSGLEGDNKDNSQKQGYAPWKSREEAYPENTYGLHCEIIDFYKYISPLPEEEAMRKDVVQRMTDLIMGIWPAAKVEVFGSFRTNLYLPTSDIDLAVFGKWEKLPLFTIEKALISKEIADPASIKVLDKATVPIIKLTDKISKIRVDISFNTESSIKSAEMIKTYIKEYSVLPYLFITLKHFLVQRDLNEVFTGGISSYCLMLLAISFLQRHPRIDAKKDKDKVNLGVLLMEFFELYGRNFNYQRIGIKIKNGGRYVSKTELMKELNNGEYPALLCIEDPVTLACDIGRSSYGILRVKEAFEYAFNVVDSALRKKHYFKVNSNSTYLSRIISVPKDLIEHRNWVKKTFDLSKPPPVFLQSTSSTPPMFHLTMPQYQTNQRPALLPTPRSPYSPHLSVISPPFSPFSTNANIIPYNPVAFFGNNTIPRQPVVLHNVSTGESVLHSVSSGTNTLNEVNRLTNLQLPTHLNDTSQIQMHQVGYMVPGVFNSPPVEHAVAVPTTPVYSPIKSNQLNNCSVSNENNKQHDNPLFPTSYQTHRTSNNTNYVKRNNLPNKQMDNHDNRSNFSRSTKNTSPNLGSQRRGSPRTSPKLNSKQMPSSQSNVDLPSWLRGGYKKDFPQLNARSDVTSEEQSLVEDNSKRNVEARSNNRNRTRNDVFASAQTERIIQSSAKGLMHCDTSEVLQQSTKNNSSALLKKPVIFDVDSSDSNEDEPKEIRKNVSLVNLVSSDESITEEQ